LLSCYAGASLPDETYVAAGADIVDTKAAFGADVVLKVRPPTTAEVAQMKKGARYMGFVWPAAHKEVVDALAARGVMSFGMEQVPRIS
jgi:NAD/NADP transhydrogenase alpha subunit